MASVVGADVKTGGQVSSTTTSLLALFAVPLVLFAGFVLAVDPYDYSPLPSPVSDELKREISFKTNYAMWKMFAYRRDPKPAILLGDRFANADTNRNQPRNGDSQSVIAMPKTRLAAQLSKIGAGSQIR